MMAMPDMVADEPWATETHCHCVPQWIKVIVPVLAALFVSFVVFSQLRQIKQLTLLQSLKEDEITELVRIRDMRDREFIDLKASMQVRNVLFREIATQVGVPGPRLDAILANDPMAPHKADK